MVAMEITDPVKGEVVQELACWRRSVSPAGDMRSSAQKAKRAAPSGAWGGPL